MSKARQMIFEKARRNQPIEELQRKWDKARGRWSKNIWGAEWLDLAWKEGEKMALYFHPYPWDAKPGQSKKSDLYHDD